MEDPIVGEALDGVGNGTTTGELEVEHELSVGADAIAEVDSRDELGRFG